MGRRGERFRSLFGHRSFALLWLGRTISWYGNALAPIGLAFAVLDLGGTVLELSAVVAARSITNAVLVLFGGVLADRAARNRILTVSAFIAASSQGMTALLVAERAASVPILIMLGVINGAAAALAGPASGAMLRQLVPDRRLRDAGVASQLGMQVALLVGTSSGGMIVALLGPAVALGVDAGTFVIAGLCFLGLPRPVPAGAARRALLDDLREGFRFVARTRWIPAMALLTFVSMASFAGGLQVLAPLVADQTFGRSGYGVIGAAQLLGPIVGAAIALSIKDRVRLSVAVLWSGVLILPLVILGAGAMGVIPARSPALGFLLATSLAMFATGIMMDLSSTFRGLAVQRQVPDDQLGRVSSYFAVASIGGLPAGEIVVAPLAALCGVGPALLLWPPDSRLASWWSRPSRRCGGSAPSRATRDPILGPNALWMLLDPLAWTK